MSEQSVPSVMNVEEVAAYLRLAQACFDAADQRRDFAARTETLVQVTIVPD